MTSIRCRIPFFPILVFSCGLWCCGGKSIPPRCVQVERGPLTRKVDANGTLASSDSILVRCPRVPNVWNFTITFLAEEGVNVDPGDVLVRFDDKALRERLVVEQSNLASTEKDLEKANIHLSQEMEKMRLDLLEARVRLDKAERKCQQPQHLLSRNELVKLRLDRDLERESLRFLEADQAFRQQQLEREIQRLTSNLAGHQRRVRELEEAISKNVVTAEQRGIVVYTEDWNGTKVQVGDEMWLGQTVLELPDLTQMMVKAEVDERDARWLASGQSVEIRLDANPDRVFQGVLSSLGQVYRQESYERPRIVVDAEITVKDPDPQVMRPGMAASLAITVEELGTVLQLPYQAVRFDGNEAQVTVMTAWGDELRNISVGRRTHDRIEVLQGLRENERVQLW